MDLDVPPLRETATARASRWLFFSAGIIVVACFTLRKPVDYVAAAMQVSRFQMKQ
jgi:hypothetical protein